MREVDISDQLLPRHHEVFRCLGLISRGIRTDRWCVVGGLMVLLAARSVGRRNSRAEGTKDGDVVVDVVAEPEILTRTTHLLISLGYKLPPEYGGGGGNFARCTFVSGRAQIDVLAPDGTPSHLLNVGSDMRSLAIPGGRRALRSAELMEIRYADDAPDVVVRVPSLISAICVKAAAAVDERTARQQRHIEDVAYLLSCIDDPVASAGELDSDDRELLRRVSRDERLAAVDGLAWALLGATDSYAGLAALGFLVGD